MTSRKAAIFINEHARSGDSALDEALAIFAETGIEAAEHRFDKPDDLDAAIRDTAPDVDLLIVGGGDGTVNAAAAALRDAGKPFGILPLGTANDLARTLGIPDDMAEAARIISEGHIRPIDLGQVNERYFFNVASLGLSTELTRALTPDLKRRWGRLGYAIATFRALRACRPFSADIVESGRTLRVHTVQIAIGNGVYYGGGLRVDEKASIEDGRLNLYSLEVSRLWRLLLIYPAFRYGRHGVWQEVRTFSGDEIVIRTTRPRTINTDGELTEKTPATFRVLPKALSVFAPPDAGKTAETT